MNNGLDLYVRIAADTARYNAGIGAASQQTRQFSEMARAQMGALKGVLAEVGMQVGAVAFAMNGVRQAATMETALNDVASNIKKSTTSAAELNAQMREVKQTAIDVAKVTPFAATDIVQIQDSLLKAGLDQQAVKGREGAAMAAAQLSALTKLDPALVGDSLARLGSMFQLKNDAYDDAAESLVRGEAASPGKLQEILYSQRMFGTTANMLGVGFNDSVALSAMMTPLGEMAGSSLNNFLLNTAGNSKAAKKAMAQVGLGSGKGDQFKSAYFENGKFIGAERATELTRKTLGKIKDDAKRMDIARDIFGEEGMRAAMQMVQATTDKTFRGIKSQMDEAIGREEKMAIKMAGFEASAKSAAGTVQTSFALAFEPFMDDLAKAAQGVNDLAGDLNKLFMAQPEKVTPGGVLSPFAWLMDSKENGGLGMTGGEVGIAALVTGGLMAALPAARLLSSGKAGGAAGAAAGAIGGALGSAANLAGGVAVGKVLQEAAGITPVFVVNMPSGGLGGENGLPDLPGAPKPAAAGAAGAAAAGLTSKLKTGYAMAKVLDLKDFLKLGVAATGTTAAGVTVAGAAGYGFGTLVDKGITAGLTALNDGKERSLGTWLYELTHDKPDFLAQTPLPAGVPPAAANPKPPAPAVVVPKPPAPVVVAPKPLVATPPVHKPLVPVSAPPVAVTPALLAPAQTATASPHEVSRSMERVLTLMGNQNTQQMTAIAKQSSESAQAMIKRIRDTEIKGSIDVKVHSAPGVQTTVSSKPANAQTNLNVGRTMDGVR